MKHSFLSYKDLIDPKRVGRHQSITIFDVDDTLVITSSQIRVKDVNTGKVFSLTPAEFNEFERREELHLDFSDFNNLEILKAGEIIEKIFKVLRKTQMKGRQIGIITARENKNHIHNFLLHHGIAVNLNYIFAVNDPKLKFIKGKTNAEKKSDAFLELIRMGFRDFIFYDDSKENLRAAEDLDSKIDGIRIKTKLVKPEWKVKR